MSKKKLKRKLCKCGCGKSANPGRRYISGHNMKYKPHNKKLREIRECLCLCGMTFVCRKDSKQRFIHGHNTKTLEGRVILQKAHLGTHHSKETNEKRVETRRKNGKPWHTKDTLKKISNTNIGKQFSNETIDNMRNASYKRWQDPVYREKQIKSHVGLVHTDEHNRHVSESLKGKYVGSLNWSWKGGISFLPYPPNFNYKLKEFIRKRDNRTCQLCNKVENEEKRRLPIHHIDYNKNNCNPANLITLCNSCNGKVNASRDYWTKFFQSKLKICNIFERQNVA